MKKSTEKIEIVNMVTAAMTDEIVETLINKAGGSIDDWVEKEYGMIIFVSIHTDKAQTLKDKVIKHYPKLMLG